VRAKGAGVVAETRKIRFVGGPGDGTVFTTEDPHLSEYRFAVMIDRKHEDWNYPGPTLKKIVVYRRRGVYDDGTEAWKID